MAKQFMTLVDVPRWLRFVVCSLALIGGGLTFFIGLAIVAITTTPDTGHGEDIGRPIAIALLVPFIVLSSLLGVGTGLGGIALMKERARLAPVIGIGLTALGIGCGLVAFWR